MTCSQPVCIVYGEQDAPENWVSLTSDASCTEDSMTVCCAAQLLVPVIADVPKMTTRDECIGIYWTGVDSSRQGTPIVPDLLRIIRLFHAYMLAGDTLRTVCYGCYDTVLS